MKIIKKIATVIGFIVIGLVIIGVVSGGSGKKKSDSTSSQETVQASESKPAEKAEEKAEEEKKPAETSEEVASSGETPDSKYAVSIDNCSVGTDWGGDPCVFITYTFTNVSNDDPASFGWSMITEVYQGGIECETALADIEGDSNYTTDIKKGNSIAVTQAYKLRDTTTDVEVEVKELISFDKKVLARQVFTIA